MDVMQVEKCCVVTNNIRVAENINKLLARKLLSQRYKRQRCLNMTSDQNKEPEDLITPLLSYKLKWKPKLVLTEEE